MRVRLIALALPALLAACGPAPEAGKGAAAKPAATPAASAPAKPAADAQVERPSLKVTTLDGAAYDLAQQRGKWVIVNYWATWCGPCLQEMPELSALAAMRQHIAVIGLAYEETTPEELRAFLAKRPVAYPIAPIDVYDPPKDFGAPRGLPTTWLIAPDGKLVRKYTGPVTARMLEDDIAAFGGPKAGANAPADGAGKAG
ncbi:TlpA family protein disulfide reductase [Thermomonas brevis]|uniref:TlpA family protein disulfide reductase n=1 Tax=Thermomonas brevis TaxID=215691 RepID=A0A7G9QRB8_9GAMM|nr:TlpA disulfide reductase family protein [Thermomonas brevis]QNN45893.1 TlpA family protein disulfide reductase [Thermomonas brevis]